MTKRKWAVIAIGGNSLIKDPQHKTVRDQYLAAKETLSLYCRTVSQIECKQ